jgi:hypothetical protein
MVIGLRSRIFAVVLVLFLAAAPIAEVAMSGEGPASPRAGWPLRVRTEWESPQYNGSANIIFNDTDRDGTVELIVWGEFQTGDGSSVNSVMVYKPPSYRMVWSANYSGWINDLTLADVDRDGHVEIVIEQSGFEGTNFTVVSGGSYETLWTGPDMEGNVFYSGIEDLDADGSLEFVWVNSSSIFDGTKFSYESHVLVYGAKSHQPEWTSPAIPQGVSDVQVAQLDPDPAMELYMLCNDRDEDFTDVNQTIRVYDGASHSLQWTAMLPGDPGWIWPLYVGDLDNDTNGEVLLQVDRSESSGVLMYAGDNGSLLLNFTLGNTTDMTALADINSDGALELLATGSEIVDADNSTYNLTHYVFDLRGCAVAWKAGPLLSDQDGSSGLQPLMQITGQFPDIVPGYLPQFILGNATVGIMSSTVVYEFIDGKTFKTLWKSPELSTMGFGGLDVLASQADSDPGVELFLTESWITVGMDIKSKLHVLSLSDFTEEWTSDELAGFVMGVGADLINDSRPEVGLQIQDYDMSTGMSTLQTRILDGDSHEALWASPKSSDQQINFSDLYGSGRNEIICIAKTTDNDRNTSSKLSVYNDTTFAQSWSGTEEQGDMETLFIGDLDNDTLGELVTSLRWEDQDWNSFTNITVREFSEKAPKLPDIAISAQDISFSNSTPVAGMPLEISVNVGNIGTLNAIGCCLTILVDEQLALETTVDVAMGNRTRIGCNWTATAGNHTFKVMADRLGLLEELNETNNNASVQLLVLERPHPVPVISSPLEGQNLPSGANTTFNGTASVFAPGGSRSFFWKYDGLTYLGNGSLFNASLPPGPHRVSLYADDGYFNASTSVNVTVGPPKPPPGTTWAVISSPEDGSEFTAGEQIRFDGSQSQAARAEYTLTYAWSSNRTGPLGVAANFTRALPAGVHNITLKVDDGHGVQSSAHVQVRLKPSTGVAAIISSPQEGQAFDASELISFDGSRSTGPQGAVLSYVWTSSLAGPMGSEKSFSRKLLAGGHTITLRVSDGQGHSSTDTVNITVTGIDDLPPTVSITYPAEGAVVSGTVNITGTAGDETAVVSVKVKIDNGPWMTADGTTSWSFSWNTTTVVNGTYTITARADDGNHTSEEASINLTVDNKPVKPSRPPADEVAFPTALLVVVAAVLVLAVAAVAFIVFRSRRRTPPAYNVVEDSRGIAPPRM